MSVPVVGLAFGYGHCVNVFRVVAHYFPITFFMSCSVRSPVSTMTLVSSSSMLSMMYCFLPRAYSFMYMPVCSPPSLTFIRFSYFSLAIICRHPLLRALAAAFVSVLSICMLSSFEATAAKFMPLLFMSGIMPSSAFDTYTDVTPLMPPNFVVNDSCAARLAVMSTAATNVDISFFILRRFLSFPYICLVCGSVRRFFPVPPPSGRSLC